MTIVVAVLAAAASSATASSAAAGHEFQRAVRAGVKAVHKARGKVEGTPKLAVADAYTAGTKAIWGRAQRIDAPNVRAILQVQLCIARIHAPRDLHVHCHD